MPAADLGVRPRYFYGWTVVATAFLVLFMAYGTQYAFGVFLAELVEEFGWSRARLSGIVSLYAFVGFSWSHDLAGSLRGLRRLRLLLRGRLHALHRDRRRLLRPRACGEPRRAALLAGRVDGRVRSVRGRLHLRSHRRLPARVVAQRRLQWAGAEPARLHAPARAARRDRGGLTPPAALA